MNYTENKKLQIAPVVGIGIILVLVALAGALFYKALMSQSTTPTVELDTKTAQQSEQNTDVELTPELELEFAQAELETITAEVSSSDPFGLEELDAELVEFTDIDELLDFEL